MYYRNAAAAIVVYDITNQASHVILMLHPLAFDISTLTGNFWSITRLD